MLANMACSLIEHKRINTTVAKAKALRQFVEPIITRSKDDSTHSRRVVFRYLRSKHAVSELFRNVAPAVSEREGGYTRIIKTGFRPGDSAEMCLIELVDFNGVYDLGKTKTKKRTRRGGAKKLEGAVAATSEAVEEVLVVDEETNKAEATAEVDEEVLEVAPEAVEEKAEELAEASEEATEEVISEVEEEVAEAATEAVEEEVAEAEAAEEAPVEEAPAEEASAEESEDTDGEEDSSDDDSNEEEKKKIKFFQR
jgi:large subunit ribosomal protein L17